MKTAVFLFALFASAQADTQISVLEFGNKKGCVHRTNGEESTTVEGVVSFWNALHRRGTQMAGMSIVPDLFVAPESSVVIGLSGDIDNLDRLTHISSVMESENSDTVGQVYLDGALCHSLVSKVDEWKDVEPGFIQNSALEAASKNFSAVRTVVDSEEAAVVVDREIGSVLGDLKKMAEEKDIKIVVHLIVEQNKQVSRRRLSRQLEEQGENVQDANEYSGYYGYGYYNDYGEWVTPFKTMFQIQYFNVVLWTSVGLALALFYTIFLMVNMPLEPDTLLFGESAKFVGED